MEQAVEIGSERHKELFCRVFLDTHDPYDPVRLPWPDLRTIELERLRALPFWTEALATEANTAAKVAALGRTERDPLLRQAIELQGYEEARHSRLLSLMARRYGLPITEEAPDPLPADLEWAFVRTEYGECFDSFFAFGLFHLARQSGLFSAPLVAIFEPVVQEEARHVLFFANWMAYRRKRLSPSLRPLHRLRCGYALCSQAWQRVKTARGVRTGDFTMRGHESIDGSISPRSFLDLCLRENAARLGRYDARLLRPVLVPAIARVARAILPR